MRIKLFIGIAFIMCIIFVSCEKNTATPQALSGTCNTSNITYNNTIQAIVSYDCAYSTSCHAAGSNYPDFTSYAGIKQYADNGQLYEQLFVSKRMPPSPQLMLDLCTLNQIQAWINTGAPQ